jgi:hypothetical protein
MGAGNYLPHGRDRYTLFYNDLSSSYLSLAEYRQLQEEYPECYADLGYEQYLQDGAEQDYEEAVGVLKDTAKFLTHQGIPVTRLDGSDRNAFERKDWLLPVFETGLVRVACKEVEISKLAVVVYAQDEEGDDGDLDCLTAKEFREYNGITRQRYITAAGLQRDALDDLLLAYGESQINLVNAKLISRRNGAWCSNVVTLADVPSLDKALRVMRRAIKAGQSRHLAKQVA